MHKQFNRVTWTDASSSGQIALYLSRYRLLDYSWMSVHITIRILSRSLAFDDLRIAPQGLLGPFSSVILQCASYFIAVQCEIVVRWLWSTLEHTHADEVVHYSDINFTIVFNVKNKMHGTM